MDTIPGHRATTLRAATVMGAMVEALTEAICHQALMGITIGTTTIITMDTATTGAVAVQGMATAIECGSQRTGTEDYTGISDCEISKYRK